MAENLVFADNNFVSDDPEDQEVFGICVRHRFFMFWHGLFSKKYLQVVRETPAELGVWFWFSLEYDCGNNII
jgi:hypothetical protein